MYRFLVRRLLALVVLLLVTSFLTFGLFILTPSNPALLACGKGCTDARVEQINRTLGLDDPFLVQYGEYMKGLVVGRDFGSGTAAINCPAPCFGRSFQNGEFVYDVIKRAMPITFSIAVGAAVLWLVVGVTIGVISALYKGRAADKTGIGLSLIGVSLPIPFTGLVLIYLIAIKYAWLPPPDSTGASLFEDGFTPWWQTFILPWIALALLYSALYARLTRANMIETMGEDFIRTARAKGLPEHSVIAKHGLRAGLTPLVTIFGLDLGGLLGGTVLTEAVFSLQGLGFTAVRAVLGQDLPMILGVTLFAAFFIIFANLVVDLLYAFIDPRVRLD